jgi:hypothetical protein
MEIVFTSLFIADAMAYCFDRPSQNLRVEMDQFTGRFNVILTN